MRNVTIGIDPGINGAVCIATSGEILDVFRLPVKVIRYANKKQKKVIDTRELSSLIEYHLKTGDNTTWVIEKVRARGGQSVTAMFNFGESLGRIFSVIEGLLSEGEDIYEISPQAWKKAFGTIGQDKDMTRLKVIDKYPDLSDKLKYKNTIDLAEAIVINLYGVEKGEKLEYKG
jgi:hypothetical protein